MRQEEFRKLPYAYSFIPLGLKDLVEVEIHEGLRPECCPDRKDCKPIHVSLMNTKENLDTGFSGSCYGYCGLKTFQYMEATHHNDISHCVITPLKGVIRFFECYEDIGNDKRDILRILQLLKPMECEECGVIREDQPLINWIIQEKPEQRKWLCLGCAVRLGIAKYHPENKGTRRMMYF